MPKGNPNPSPATRFGAGQKGNPIGRTGLQRELEIQNAAIATKIRARLLEAVQAALHEDTSTAAALDRIEGNILKLLKDAEDRGLGTPQGSIDVTTNGKDIPSGLDLSQLSSAALSEIVALADAAKKP